MEPETPATKEQLRRLHTEIMNLQEGYTGDCNDEERKVYAWGHKDARHAAAERVAAMLLECFKVTLPYSAYRRGDLVEYNNGGPQNEEWKRGVVVKAMPSRVHVEVGDKLVQPAPRCLRKLPPDAGFEG